MTGVLAGTLRSISTALRSAFVAERTATADGFMQRLDPRVALLGTVALLLAALVTRSVAVLVCLGVVLAVLARRSAVPLRRLLARSAAVPLASFAVVLPQLVMMPGEPLASAFGLTATRAGAAYVLLFSLRVGVTVAALSLLVLTTRFSALLAAMRELGVPTTFVWVVALTYRYLFLFFDELRRTLLARESRRVGDARETWAELGGLTGSFLLRSVERSERIHRGMCARGGRRPPSPYPRRTRLGGGDALFAATTVTALALSGGLRWLA